MSKLVVYVDLDEGPIRLSDQVNWLNERLPATMRAFKDGGALAVNVAHATSAEAAMEEVTQALIEKSVKGHIHVPKTDQAAANIFPVQSPLIVVVVVRDGAVYEAIRCKDSSEAERLMRSKAEEYGVNVTDDNIDDGYVMTDVGSICITWPTPA